jgi:general stress protein YciG
MQVMLMNPGEFGNNQGNEMFRGQSAGFSQNNPSSQNNNTYGNSSLQSNDSGLNQNNTTARNNSSGNGNGQKRRGRGFASMDPERVSEIASMGGKAAHAQGVAHEWTPDEARAAGKKGGQASRGTRSNSEQAGGGSL